MRTWLCALCGILAATAATAATAAPAAATDPQSLQMKLDRAVVTWSAAEGLEVSYDGVPVLLPNSGEIVVHTADWKRSLYRGNDGVPRATLARKGGRQILTIRTPEGGFAGTQVITAGPGDRIRIEWRYRQDAWDDAALQLGLPRPSEHFLAGASFRGRAAGKPIQGTIPEAAPEKTTHPFTGASEVTFSSLGGTLRVTTDKPVTLYDYPARGSFFLGLDEPLPRGKAMAFAAELAFSPAAVEGEGLLFGRLLMPKKVEDATLRASLRVASKPGKARAARVALVGTDPNGQPLRVEREVSATAAGILASLSQPVSLAGRYRCRVLVTSLPDGKEALRTPEFTMDVTPLFSVLPDRSFYTTEAKGALLVRTSPGLKGRALTFSAEGNGLAIRGAAAPGERAAIPFDAAALAQGRTEITCRLLEGERELWRAPATLTRLPPRANEVKVDYAGRGLIVDGSPFLPFGFYCWAPPGDLPTQEATQGFVHIAPYQWTVTIEAMKEYLDRCAAVGMKVHFDIRGVAQQKPSPEKWQRLREWVEVAKDHPALLAYYLCDEPDGQSIPADRLEEAYRFVKELDPYHPITIVLMGTGKAKEYLGAMDILMHDPYPIPSRPVTEVADATDRLNVTVDGGMPLWIVPQAFGGGEWWRREPSVQEERVMTYLALIHGATGIQYFIRRPPVGNPSSTNLWSECRRLALEGQELAPALLSGEPRPAVKSSDAAVHAAAWRRSGAITVLAANTQNRPTMVKLQLGEALNATGEVLFAGRPIEVKAGVIEDMMDGFGTRAYRIPVGPRPLQLADAGAGNLVVNPSFEECANTGSPDGCYVTAGKDPGASLFIDPRHAVHGERSLRLTTPAEGQGVVVRPFPIPVKAGQRYRLTVWARGLQEGQRLRFGMRDLDCGEKEFPLTREWAAYTLEGTAPEEKRRGQIVLELRTAGTAWVDLVQMVEVTSNP